MLMSPRMRMPSCRVRGTPPTSCPTPHTHTHTHRAPVPQKEEKIPTHDTYAPSTLRNGRSHHRQLIPTPITPLITAHRCRWRPGLGPRHHRRRPREGRLAGLPAQTHPYIHPYTHALCTSIHRHLHTSTHTQHTAITNAAEAFEPNGVTQTAPPPPSTPSTPSRTLDVTNDAGWVGAPRHSSLVR
jgi:hypothetical protein